MTRALLNQYLRPQWPQVALLTWLLGCSIGLQLYSPQILRQFIDAANGSAAATERLPRLGELFLMAALGNQVLTALARYTGERVAWTATNRLRDTLTLHTLRLGLGFHKRHRPGDLVERIDGDVTALSGFFSQVLVELLAGLVILVGVLVLLFREDWRVGLCMSLFSTVTLVVLVCLRRATAHFSREERAQSAAMYGTLGEQLSGLEEIRASGAEGWAISRFQRQFQQWTRSLIRATLFGFALMWSSSLLMLALGHAVAFLICGVLYRQGAVTLGGIYLIIHYTELLRRPMERIRTQVQELQRAGAVIRRIQDLMETTPEPAGGASPHLPGAPSVTFRHVSFQYEDGGEPVLQDLSFHLPAGAVLGLLGRTGSGKTTLARLLVRFHDPTSGEILLGDRPLRDLRVDCVRQQVGFVTQDVQLFEASVRENLTFFDPTVPDERILQSIEDLGLGGWFSALPHGLETRLKPGGGGLSAGEAQLLALARIFLRDPGVIILDEPSSRLDPATEAAMERAVTRLLQGRTAIIIAHRLATVARADQILILDGGQVAERGKRERLAADPRSRFRQLLRAGMAEVMG